MNGKKKVFKRTQISLMDVPESPELSVKKLWEVWKNNEVINEYIPDYLDSELPEREFLFGIVGTLYNVELTKVITKAFLHRKQKYKTDNEDAIEVTKEMLELIKSINSYKTTPSRGLSLFKIKAIWKRKLKPSIKFPVDLQRFANIPRRKVKRLPQKESLENQSYIVQRDERREKDCADPISFKKKRE